VAVAMDRLAQLMPCAKQRLNAWSWRMRSLSQLGAVLGGWLRKGGAAVTVCRRCLLQQFLRYHCVGHGSVTSPETLLGYTAFVHIRISCVI